MAVENGLGEAFLVEPLIATPQSNYAVPSLPVTVFLSIIRIQSLSSNVCVRQLVMVIAM